MLKFGKLKKSRVGFVSQINISSNNKTNKSRKKKSKQAEKKKQEHI